jgi:hypothetical protein
VDRAFLSFFLIFMPRFMKRLRAPIAAGLMNLYWAGLCSYILSALK